jgi:pimeloyl-ACP methyl ester carboxylesterase
MDPHRHSSPHQPPPADTSLAAAALIRDATIAELSGLCYKPLHTISSSLPPSLKLITHGAVKPITTWYLAYGTIPESSSNANNTSPSSSPSSSSPSSTSPSSSPRLYLFLRGVAWRANPDFSDNINLWYSISLKSFPQPFYPDHTSSNIEVHSGILELAEQVWNQVAPHIEQFRQNNNKKSNCNGMVFAGHSLGGSIALLLAAKARLHDRLDVRECITFGSPPVLSYIPPNNSTNYGTDNSSSSNIIPFRSNILPAIGLRGTSVRNYILDNDPIPRAMLAADPAFSALKENNIIKSLLQLRERMAGKGASFTPERFLFQPAGAVHLIKWSADRGQTVREIVEPREIIKELALDVGAMRGSPLAVARAVLDHHHGSYAQELKGAAMALKNSSYKEEG